MESASLVARKTSQWRETLRCWVVAGFEYAARVTAMREGHVWHPMLPVKTDAKQLSLDSKIADITGCEHLSWRALSSPAELGRAGVSQTDPLQQGCERRALCGLGTAETLFRRSSRGLKIAACIAEHAMFAMPSAFNMNKIADSFWRVMFNYLQLSPMGPADIVCGPLI